MKKAIGFIACVSVMAMSLYLFSGGDPSRILSAQTESSGSGYGAVARRFLNDAQQLAKQGNVKEARRLAETAASLSGNWAEGETTPQQFLAELDKSSGGTANPFDLEAASEWPEAAGDSSKDKTLFDQSVAKKEEPLPRNAGLEMINRRKATKLMEESRTALKAGDIATARARAMQAKTLKVSWGLWDERPEHLLSEIDRADGTTTFFADGRTSGGAPARPQSAEETYQQAKQLLVQAREAMDAGRIQTATDLANKAETLNATYTLWEDSPTVVLRDIARLKQVGTAPANVFDEQKVAASPKKQQAETLLKDARNALKEGRFGFAQEKAQQALDLNVAYSLFEDTPERVLSEIEQALGGQSRTAQPNADVAFFDNDAGFQNFEQGGPVDMTPQPATENDNVLTLNDVTPQAQPTVPVPSNSGVQPGGGSAEALMQYGVAMLENGQPTAALEALNQAMSQVNQLPRQEQVALQNYLAQAQAAANLTLVSASQVDSTVEIPAPSNMDPMAETDPLEEAANAMDVQYSKLRTEVVNSVFRAEKLKDKNPQEALEALARTRETVEAASLPEDSLKVLTGHIERATKSIETYMEQRAPLIAMEERNRNTKETIERQVQNQIRIEQEFAELVQQFNELMNQRRYPEAELIAKKARDLNPNLPQAVVMVEKAKLQKRIDEIESQKERKSDNALKALSDVDESFAQPFVDYGFGDVKRWKDITTRRSGYGSASARQRTESEQKIEESLGQKISLHFHDVPLTDIIRHIATTHGINIALDKRAIESDGLMIDQSVSIDVDGIQLRSALNLLLDQAGGMVYDIRNEVLTITNRLEQETRFRVEAYNVADLVVPLSVQSTQTDPFAATANPGYSGSGLFQVDDQLAVGIRGNGFPGDAADASPADVDFSGLIDLISTTVEPGTWDVDGGAGRMQGNENTLSLVIRQTPAVHDQIVDLLGQLRKLQDLQVTVEVRFISVTDRFFERIGVDFDFNVQDTLGDPPGVPAFGSRQLTFPGGGGGAGGGGGGNDLAGNQNGGGGQGGQQNQQGAATGLFDSITRVNAPRDDFSSTVAGLASPDAFTEDYDIQFRQGSFELGVPDFGNFNPDAGIQVGMAILSDIEAFFFIQAAQADERANIMFAPKVTLFNGQPATIFDTTQRPFVISLVPVTGTGSVGFQPIIQSIPDGITLTVVAVISADRRFVRLSLAPQFQNVVDVFTFSFASGGAGGGAGLGGQGGGFGGGGGGFGGGAGGGGFGGGGAIGGGNGQGGQQGQQGQAGVGGGTLTVQQPVFETISVQTTVSVPDGGTVLLGGIKRLREGRNMAGVPILNKIPYVSRLFKNSGVGRETESVMLMVTPRIIIHEEEEEVILGTSGL